MRKGGREGGRELTPDVLLLGHHMVGGAGGLDDGYVHILRGGGESGVAGGSLVTEPIRSRCSRVALLLRSRSPFPTATSVFWTARQPNPRQPLVRSSHLGLSTAGCGSSQFQFVLEALHAG